MPAAAAVNEPGVHARTANLNQLRRIGQSLFASVLLLPEYERACALVRAPIIGVQKQTCTYMSQEWGDFTTRTTNT